MHEQISIVLIIVFYLVTLVMYIISWKLFSEVLPRPTNFHVVQQVGSDTLLVGWNYVNPSLLDGFEVNIWQSDLFRWYMKYIHWKSTNYKNILMTKLFNAFLYNWILYSDFGLRNLEVLFKNSYILIIPLHIGGWILLTLHFSK